MHCKMFTASLVSTKEVRGAPTPPPQVMTIKGVCGTWAEAPSAPHPGRGNSAGRQSLLSHQHPPGSESGGTLCCTSASLLYT